MRNPWRGLPRWYWLAVAGWALLLLWAILR